MVSETEIREVIEKYESTQWKSVSDLPKDRDEEERLLLCVTDLLCDEEGERHEVEYVTTGTIYVTTHQIVALADDGNEFLDEEILGWRTIPYFPRKEACDVHNS